MYGGYWGAPSVKAHSHLVAINVGRVPCEPDLVVRDVTRLLLDVRTNAQRTIMRLRSSHDRGRATQPNGGHRRLRRQCHCLIALEPYTAPPGSLEAEFAEGLPGLVEVPLALIKTARGHRQSVLYTDALGPG